MMQETDDAAWFQRNPDKWQRIRPATPGERLAHRRRFAWVIKGAAGGLSYEFGEI
jgi:hypothetical protein